MGATGERGLGRGEARGRRREGERRRPPLRPEEREPPLRAQVDVPHLHSSICATAEGLELSIDFRPRADAAYESALPSGDLQRDGDLASESGSSSWPSSWGSCGSQSSGGSGGSGTALPTGGAAGGEGGGGGGFADFGLSGHDMARLAKAFQTHGVRACL